jgi:hypothetical protein
MNDFSKNETADWRDFARLQNHRATGRERWRNLRDNLVQRPIPGRDQCRDANALLDETGVSSVFKENKVLERLDGRLEVGATGPGLRIF